MVYGFCQLGILIFIPFGAAFFALYPVSELVDLRALAFELWIINIISIGLCYIVVRLGREALRMVPFGSIVVASEPLLVIWLILQMIFGPPILLFCA